MTTPSMASQTDTTAPTQLFIKVSNIGGYTVFMVEFFFTIVNIFYAVMYCSSDGLGFRWEKGVAHFVSFLTKPSTDHCMAHASAKSLHSCCSAPPTFCWSRSGSGIDPEAKDTSLLTELTMSLPTPST